MTPNRPLKEVARTLITGGDPFKVLSYHTIKQAGVLYGCNKLWTINLFIGPDAGKILTLVLSVSFQDWIV